MSNPNSTLETFAAWLQSLGRDAVAMSEVLEAEATRPPASSPSREAGERRLSALELLAGGLHYLFKSIDLIQDGSEDLGYVDDCLMIRVCSALALPGVSVGADVLQRLGNDAETVRDFLGEQDYERLERHAKSARQLRVRGRTPRDVADHEEVLQALVGEVAAWAKAYQVPTFTRDPKTLARLRSFLAARLPS